jgi:2-polyprenyl-6-methoxyphenol hydroxylase-like FAD-dependent oxidoreductase
MTALAQTAVVIIGAGPVGLTTALLLDGFGVDHWVVEQRSAPGDHPQAHVLSTRSMEIFREIPGLEAAIRAKAPPLETWRHYIYCTDLYHLPDTVGPSKAPQASLLGTRDHFPDGPDHGISPTWECHLPQNKLVAALREAVDTGKHSRLEMGSRAEIEEDPSGVTVNLTSGDAKTTQVVRCRYAVCADGAHGHCRRSLGIGLRKFGPRGQVFVSVHFFSRALSTLLSRRLRGMLYFIYSPAGIAILVNHDLDTGEFVLQLPIFPPHQEIDGFTKPVCAQLIDKLAGTPVDPDIRSVRPWRLGAWVARRYDTASGRCFIAGDAAHQFLPAGGFGLNCGIADAHNLAWKLALALKKEPVPVTLKGHLLSTYSQERRPLAEGYLERSQRSFEKILAVASAIGLEWQAARWLDWLVRLLPLPGYLGRRLFALGIRMGLSQVGLLAGKNLVARQRRKQLERLFGNPDANLALRYPREDLGFAYRRGWLVGTGETGVPRAEMNETYTPRMVLGGRLPHFWLQPAEETEASPRSSLDLPPHLAETHQAPVHLLLLIDLSLSLGRRLRSLYGERFGKPILVQIRSAPQRSATADYLLRFEAGTYQPPRGAYLIRPDGIVAWIW